MAQTGGRIETWPHEPLRKGEAPPADPPGRLHMDAVLRPNRSLSGPAFLILMSVLVAASFFAGIAFISMGAWPVVGFFGLDVFLVWLAFRLSYRSGRLREAVRVTADTVEVLRIYPSGHARRWRAAPWLVRVETDRPMKHDGQVRLVSSGRVLVLGAFLSPPERATFGARLVGALDGARREGWPAGV